MSEMLERQDDGDPFSDVVMARLREAVSAAAWDDDHPALDAALRVLIAESRRRGLAPERVVLILKRIWRTTHRPPDMGAEEWDLMYRDAVDTKLAMYFEDTRPACPRPRTSARTSIAPSRRAHARSSSPRVPRRPPRARINSIMRRQVTSTAHAMRAAGMSERDATAAIRAHIRFVLYDGGLREREAEPIVLRANTWAHEIFRAA